MSTKSGEDPAPLRGFLLGHIGGGAPVSLSRWAIMRLSCKITFVEGIICMNTVPEIKSAVSKLSREELATFRVWFEEFDAEAWDRQFEADVKAGRLDLLAEEALRDLHEGRCTDL